MDQQTPTTSSSSSSTTSTPVADAASSAAIEPPLTAPQQHPLQPASSLLPSTQPTPNPRPSTLGTPGNPQSQQPPSRLHSRPLWQHPHFHHFSSSPSPSAPTTLPVSASAVSPSVSPSQPRAGATHPTPSPSSSFSSSFRQQQQQFGGLGRGLPESTSTITTSQARPGVQGMGMVGSMSSSPQLRPSGIGVSSPHHPRPVQSSLRPPPSLSNTPSPVPQNFQGHSFMRSSSGGPSPVQPTTSQSPNQPWMSSGKPPLPSPSYRPQMTSPSMPPRSITAQLQQQQSLSSTSPQHQQVLRPQQHLASHQHPDHHGQQVPPSKFPQSSTQPQSMARGQGSGSQKAASPAVVQPNAVQSVAQSKIPNAESELSSGRILSKRTIHELVSQIDPTERLDPEVEDILADIADEFVESITTFGCSLAKHRKSDRLEAKDILLHVEKNWNITLPGFSGDEIKTYRKPIVNDIHKERLAAIKKSVLASDMANAKNPVGQVVGNAKNNQTKMPASAILSPNLKVHEIS